MKEFFTRLKSSNFIYIFLLAIIAVFAFWQVSFLQYATKWDIIDYFLPSKYIIGEMLQNKMLPLWNPYQTLGYPIQADPQAGAAYPITWILGFVWGYNIDIISIEFILHVFFAGWGMFILSKTLNYNKNISFILAVSYMLCGLFVGNAEHLSWIISGAWMPFVVSYFIDIHRNKTILNALKLALFSFLFLNGYPAFVFILIYFVLILFIYFLYIEYQSNKWRGIRQYISLLSLSGAILLITSSVIIIGYYYVFPYLSRSGGVTREWMLALPFSPKSMISFITPYATAIHHPEKFYGTVYSMNNGYFGIIIFIFAVIAIFLKKQVLHWIFLIFALFSLLASFGDVTPLREFLYDYVPLMNLFKYPAVFRNFFIFFMLLITGSVMQQLFLNRKKISKISVIIAASIILLIVLAIIYLNHQAPLNLRACFKNDFMQFNENLNVYQHFAFQGILQIVVLFCFIVLMLWRTSGIKKIKWITFLIVVEMITATQLNAPCTVYEYQAPNRLYRGFINNSPKGFPMLTNDPILLNEQNAPKEGPFWRNLSMFHKQISYDGWTPFTFKYADFWNNTVPGIYNAMLKNGPVYLSNSIWPDNLMTVHEKNKIYDSTYIYIESSEYNKLNNILRSSDNIGCFRITKFNPHLLEVNCTMNSAGILAFQQNKYVGWKAKVNGKNSEILKLNKGIMGVFLNKGKNLIQFKYQPVDIIFAFYLTIISFCLLCITILYLSWKKKSFYMRGS